MSYAVIEAGGTQFRVKKGDLVRIPALRAEVGSTIAFTPLVVHDGEKTRIGNPAIEGAEVRCRVIEHGRGKKVIVFKFKRRKQYRRKKGHRQKYTAIRVEDIITE